MSSEQGETSQGLKSGLALNGADVKAGEAGRAVLPAMGVPTPRTRGTLDLNPDHVLMPKAVSLIHGSQEGHAVSHRPREVRTHTSFL